MLAEKLSLQLPSRQVQNTAFQPPYVPIQKILGRLEVHDKMLANILHDLKRLVHIIHGQPNQFFSQVGPDESARTINRSTSNSPWNLVQNSVVLNLELQRCRT